MSTMIHQRNRNETCRHSLNHCMTQSWSWSWSWRYPPLSMWVGVPKGRGGSLTGALRGGGGGLERGLNDPSPRANLFSTTLSVVADRVADAHYYLFLWTFTLRACAHMVLTREHYLCCHAICTTPYHESPGLRTCTTHRTLTIAGTQVSCPSRGLPCE